MHRSVENRRTVGQRFVYAAFKWDLDLLARRRYRDGDVLMPQQSGVESLDIACELAVTHDELEKPNSVWVTPRSNT